jgi:hypothetical protein
MATITSAPISCSKLLHGILQGDYPCSRWRLRARRNTLPEHLDLFPEGVCFAGPLRTDKTRSKRTAPLFPVLLGSQYLQADWTPIERPTYFEEGELSPATLEHTSTLPTTVLLSPTTDAVSENYSQLFSPTAPRYDSLPQRPTSPAARADTPYSEHAWRHHLCSRSPLPDRTTLHWERGQIGSDILNFGENFSERLQNLSALLIDDSARLSSAVEELVRSQPELLYRRFPSARRLLLAPPLPPRKLPPPIPHS